MKRSWLNDLRHQILGSRRRKGAAKRVDPRSRLKLEALEDRLAPATFYVDNTMIGSAGSGAATFTPNGGDHAPVSGLTLGTDFFTTIQDAVNAAAANGTGGDVIKVADGTYEELVSVGEAGLDVQGNKYLTDARTRTATDESIVRGALNGSNRTTSFIITGTDVSVEGFTVRDQSDPNQFGAGIVLNAVTGATVRNNIIANNVIGLFTRASSSLISQNLFDGNNTIGPGGAAAIFSEGSADLTVDNNAFVNHTAPLGSIIRFVGPDAVSTVNHTNLTFTNNLLDDNGSGVFAMTVSGGLFQGNTISTAGAATALTFGEAVTGVDVLFNDLRDNARGLRIAEFGFVTGTNPASDVEAHFNDLSNNSEFGVGIVDFGVGDGYTGTLDVTCNWWGDVTGPTTTDNPGGMGTAIQNDFADDIDFQPWLLYGDDDPAAVGFQAPTVFTVMAQTSDFTPTNNNYRRLVNALDCIQPNQTVILSGNFDWTETNAADSWSRGNDDIAGTTADNYSLLITPDVNGVTVTAASLGAAQISGPGDLSGVDLEGVFVFNGGVNQGWTISNLEILDFDLSIAMFGLTATAFNDTTITNNHIRLARDLAVPADVFQNIGILYSFGTDQIISNNLIEIPGDGVSDTAGGNLAASVGMQSQSFGAGTAYDGLLIDNNTINVLNAQSADPERVLGIWENGLAHGSNITISNNDFVNLAAGNDPALNGQRAFRITSHSTATSTVLYAANTVSGANIGFQWDDTTSYAGTQPVQLTGNTITNSDTGVLVQSDGSVELFANTITGSGAAGVNVLSGMLASATQNFITGGTGDGILLGVGGGTGSIFNNDLSGNTGFGVNNLTGVTVDASGNWWGTSTPAGVAGEVNGPVDYTPWLDVGTDTSASAGFQGDFSTLHVDDSSPQVGSTGRIQEGINLTSGATPTVIIEEGVYAETSPTANVVANKAGLVLDGATGIAADVVLIPTSGGNGITVTANNVTIRDLRITGAGTGLVASGVTPLTLINLQIDGNTAGGTLANVATVDFTASPNADTIAVDGDDFSVTGVQPVQSIDYTGVVDLFIRGGDAADTFNVSPPMSGGTNILIDGDAPSMAPGDVLNFDAQGQSVTDDGDTLTASGFEPVDYTEIETVNLLNATGGLVVDGTPAADTLRLFVDPVVGPAYQLNMGPIVALGGATSFTFNGMDGGDTMIVDLTDGDPIPAGNAFFNGGGPTMGPGDALEVIGDGDDVGFYNPSPTTPGNGNVQIVGKGFVVFTGLEPTTVSGMASFTFPTPNSDDVLTIDSPAAGQNRISGTSGGVPFEALTFFDITNFILDAGVNDGALPGDSVTLDASGLVASGLVNFVINTGAGGDSLTALSTNYSTPGSAGGVTFNGGSGLDLFFGNADISYTLTDAGVTSSGGGTINFSSVEQADLTGGPSDNTFDVSGFTQTASLNGAGGTADAVISQNDENFNLSNSLLTRSGGGTFILNSIEQAQLTGGTSANSFLVSNYGGTATLDGVGLGDSYQVTVGGGGTVNIMDTGATGLDQATIIGSNSSNTFDITPSQTTSGSDTVNYTANLERLTVNGLDGDDTFNAAPSSTAEYFINGGNPTMPPGDTLNLDLTGVTGTTFTPTGPGSGQVTFSNRMPVNFTSIETLGPIVSITANDPSATETTPPAAADPGQFTVTRTGDTTSALTVNYTVTGTATNGADYVLLTGTVVIGAGMSSAVIDVTPINDAMTEPSETVIVTIDPGAYIVDAANSATVTIADNEPEVSVVANDPSAAEHAAPASPNPGQFTVTRTGDTTAALTVNYTVTGTATNGVDYSTLSGSVVIDAGQSSATIDVNVINDPDTELPESVVVTLTADPSYTLANPTSAFVIIADNEPEVSIVANDPSAAEHAAPASANPGQFTVTRTGDTTSALTVNYTVGGTATNGADYTLLTGTVVIGMGQSSAVIDVDVINDAMTEGSETVIVTLAAGAYTVASPDSATVTIADNEPEVSIVANDPSAAEHAAPASPNPGQFTVTRTGDTTSALTVNYTVGGTATNGTDYSTLTGSVVLGAGMSSAVIDVNVINDALTEGAETVDVTLAAGAYTVASPDSATVTIADNEPEVSIVANDASASEHAAPASANPGQFTVTRTGDTTSALTVNYTVGGTATNGADYTLLTGTVVIGMGQSSAVIDVDVINDAMTEGSETVIVTLAAGAYTIASPDSATVTIADNEPEVSIVANDATATEPPVVDPGQFTVTRTGDTTSALTVNYIVTGTAGNGTDYSMLTGSVVIGAGMSSAVIDVTPLADALIEPDETVIVTLAAGAYTIADPTSATVILVDSGSFTGQVLFDFNTNGIADPGDRGVENQTVFIDSNDNSSLDMGEPFDVTDPNGTYVLTGLVSGVPVTVALLEGNSFSPSSPTSVMATPTPGGTGPTFLGVPFTNFAPVFVTPGDPPADPDGDRAFVLGLYHDLLGRDGTADAGVNGWVALLDGGAPRSNVVLGILNSNEYRGRQVDHFFDVYLGRAADAAGRQGWINFLQSGGSEEDLTVAFLTSPEYQSMTPGNDAFVRSLYNRLLGRDGGNGEVNGWLAFLNAGGSRADVVRGFLNSQEASLRALDSFYATFLLRQTNGGDQGAWLPILQSPGGDAIDVMLGVLASDEYRARFPA